MQSPSGLSCERLGGSTILGALRDNNAETSNCLCQPESAGVAHPSGALTRLDARLGRIRAREGDLPGRL